MSSSDVPAPTPSPTVGGPTPPAGWAAPGAVPSPGPEAPQQPRYGAYGAAPAGTVPPAPAGPGGLLDLAPRPGIIPLRPLSLGEILEGAFRALRVNPRAMFVPALIIMSVIGLVSGAATFTAGRLLDDIPLLPGLDEGTVPPDAEAAIGSVAQLAGSLTASLLSILASAVLTGLLIVAVSRAVLGRVPTPGEAWERTRGRVWPLIGQTIIIQVLSGALMALVAIGVVLVVGSLLAAAVAGGGDEVGAAGLGLALLALLVLLLAAVAVAFLVQTRLIAAPAALVLENVGIIESVKRSWALTRGSFWRVLGIYLLTNVIVGVVSGVLGGVLGVGQTVSMMASPSAYLWTTTATSFLTAVLSALVMPFSAAVYALVYIDLRMRKEGLDVELRRSAAA